MEEKTKACKENEVSRILLTSRPNWLEENMKTKIFKTSISKYILRYRDIF